MSLTNLSEYKYKWVHRVYNFLHYHRFINLTHTQPEGRLLFTYIIIYNDAYDLEVFQHEISGIWVELVVHVWINGASTNNVVLPRKHFQYKLLHESLCIFNVLTQELKLRN